MRKSVLTDEILLSIQQPGRYIGGEVNMVNKDPFKVDVRFAMCFNDYYGGPDHFELLPGYDEGKLKAQIGEKYPEWDLIPDEIFMGRLIDLTLTEQIFCKAIGNSGRLLLSISDSYHRINIELPKEYAKLSDEEILKKDAELIQVSSRSLLPEDGEIIHEIKIYRNAEAFCVGSPSCLRRF